MKPIQPQQRDCIPREVATAMLTEPRARLSNTMRKNCIAARQKVFASTSPIRRMPAQGPEGDIIKGWGYTEIEPRTPDEKMKRRFARASLRQLGNWLRRSIARRAPLQRAFLAIAGTTLKHERARYAIAQAVQRLDLIRDVCEDEIKMRSDKCDEIVAFRRSGRTSVDFLPVCIADMVS